MKLKSVVLTSALFFACIPAWGQQNVDKEIIYKWYEGGEVHYAEWPPRGLEDYIKLNTQGMVITDRPDPESFLIIRPVRPEKTAAEKDKAEQDKPSTREGIITRRKRCENARKDLTTINGKRTVYEEDEAGNLVPLSADELSRRKENAQAEVARFCSDDSSQDSSSNIIVK